MVQSIDSLLCLLLTVKVIFPNIPLVNMAMVNSLVLSRHMLLADWFLVALSLIDYSAPFRGDDYCDDRVCLCLSTSKSPELHVQFLPNFLCLLAVSWSCGGVLIRYVLPVLWITSYLHTNDSISHLKPRWKSMYPKARYSDRCCSPSTAAWWLTSLRLTASDTTSTPTTHSFTLRCTQTTQLMACPFSLHVPPMSSSGICRTDSS